MEMSRPVEISVRGHVVTDSPGNWFVVRVALRYDPEADPRAVHLIFPGGTEWVFSRDLLEAGLLTPQRSGDVGVWPCGRAQAVLEFHSAHGVAVVQFDKAPLLRFLGRTHEARAHEALAQEARAHQALAQEARRDEARPREEAPHTVGHGGPPR
ncbi:SsgA family sporulation/cell division regulator [Streptomyces sp. NPDC051322]|uniref:SsgA family sporulation/cell division regulator n=1 Tax=Streptomyces sp. NPDC051322 TaxID=3154645 RepID=UPI00344D63B1